MDRARFAGALVGAAVGEGMGARWDGLPPHRIAELAPCALLPGRGELLEAWDDPAALALAVQRRRWLVGRRGVEGWFADVLAGEADPWAPPGDEDLAAAVDAVSRVRGRDDAASALARARGWTDGVPLVLADVVAAALCAAGAHPHDVVAAAEAAVRLGGATRRTAAMAGALVGAARGAAGVRHDVEHRWLSTRLAHRARIGLHAGVLGLCGDGLALALSELAWWCAELHALAVRRAAFLLAAGASAVAPPAIALANVVVVYECGHPLETTPLMMGEVAKRVELYMLAHAPPRTLQEVYGAMEVPKDAWGNDFVLVVPGREGREYDLVSFGSDGEPGGQGNAEDLWLSAVRRR